MASQSKLQSTFEKSGTWCYVKLKHLGTKLELRIYKRDCTNVFRLIVFR